MLTTERSTATSNACARSSAKSIPISTQSKHCMASATDTASPDQKASSGGVGPRARPVSRRREPRRPGGIFGSRLGQTIVLLNLLGLTVLLGGAMVFNQGGQALIRMRQDSLALQGEL